MGIATGAAELLFRIAKKITFKGKLLQIGNQDILFSQEQLSKMLRRYKFNDIKINQKKVESKFFFKSLKFDNIKSLDINAYENADIIEDLNHPIKKKYYNHFDFIYDGGSLEHVFNISEGLQNLSRMVKLRGHVMHLLPCNNYIDHGFYSISPTLLKDFYTQNNFQVIEIYLIKQGHDLSKHTSWSVYDYNNEQIKHYAKWNWGDNRMLVWIVVKKIKKLSKIVFPTQSKYLKLHKHKTENKNSSKNYIKKNYPIVFKVLKVSKNSISKIINKDKKIKINIKPKLIFKC